MGKYGQAAIRATEILRAGECVAAEEAWQIAVSGLFPGKLEAQKKSCPRATYFGLCEEGLVVGVDAADCKAGADNKAYAVEAVRLLCEEPALAEAGPTALWRRVMNGRIKEANHQMDVVLTLWGQGLITR